MELIRESLVDFVQAEPFAPIHVRVGQNATQELGDTSDIDLQYGGAGSQDIGEEHS